MHVVTFVTVCLLFCTLLPAAKLRNCAFPSAIGVFSVTVRETRHFQDNALNTGPHNPASEIAMTERHVTEERRLASANSPCRLGLQGCHTVFVVNSQVRQFSRKLLVTSRHVECADVVQTDTESRMRGWGVGVYG